MKRLILSLLLSSAASLTAAVTVESTASYTDAQTGLTILSGEVSLPADAWWGVKNVAAGSCIEQLQTMPPRETLEGMRGDRAQRAERARMLRSARGELSSVYWWCNDYARNHAGTGPSSWADMDTNHWSYLSAQSTNFFLVPGVRISNAVNTAWGTSGVEVLAIELNPAIDDGQQWILRANGECVRRAIDADLVARHHLTIRPQHSAEIAPAPKAGTTAKYRIFALRKAGVPAGKAGITFVSSTDQTIDGIWDCAAPAPGDSDLPAQWATQRGSRWAFLIAQAGESPILQNWLEIQQQLHKGAHIGDWLNQGEDTRQRADVFGVLGGRAALRETLQMQALRPGVDRPGDAVRVADIPSVQVKSHPFEEMLKGAAGGSLELADHAPKDSLFVYFAKPGAVTPLLDEGSDFLFKAALPLSGNNIGYDLKGRYFARLGISESWTKLVLATGAIKDMAVLMPDLFLIDGTEVTVLARLSSPKAMQPLLKSLGLADLSSGAVALPRTGGGESWWALDGSLLVFGTSRAGVEKVLALGKDNRDSLGKSAEFRYMLTQMPVLPDTRALIYISDPFIRSLVSPQTKIAQLRRLQARGEMETITAAALLYKADGLPGTPDLPGLAAKGYLASGLVKPDYALRDDLAVVSGKYGTLADMKSLQARPVETATQAEAMAYKAYLDNYTQFWRQYFDPIAIRLDDRPDGGLSLTTFILPLLDSSIYNSLKEMAADRGNGKPLVVPELTPRPVVQFSLNLKEKAWIDVTESMSEDIGRMLHLDPAVFDELGPSVHFAVRDSDPVLAIGGSDLLGAFGGDATLMRGGELVMMPLMASLLTRPCTLMVELHNPEAVIAALNSAAATPDFERNPRELNIHYYKVEGVNQWVCSVEFAGIVKMRFGLEVRQGLLFIDNLPWSPRAEKIALRPSDLNGLSLTVRPDAAKLQLAALFTTAMENERMAAMQGIASLYPMMLAGSPDVKTARARLAALFGYAPEHPGNGEWIWENGELRSSVFGTPGRQIQPAHKAGTQDFGVFNGVEEFTLGLQFEDTGLRIRADWKVTGR